MLSPQMNPRMEKDTLKKNLKLCWEEEEETLILNIEKELLQIIHDIKLNNTNLKQNNIDIIKQNETILLKTDQELLQLISKIITNIKQNNTDINQNNTLLKMIEQELLKIITYLKQNYTDLKQEIDDLKNEIKELEGWNNPPFFWGIDMCNHLEVILIYNGTKEPMLFKTSAQWLT